MKRNSHLHLLIVCLCLLIYLYSCGSKEVSIVAIVTPSSEFNQFVEVNRLKSPEEFVTWWNSVEYKNYKFYLYRQLDPNSPIIWPDNDDGSQVYESKILNCYRINILIEKIFDNSTLVKVYQPSVAYDHYYLLLQNGDIINNTNDGKLMTLKYIKAGKI